MDGGHWCSFGSVDENALPLQKPPGAILPESMGDLAVCWPRQFSLCARKGTARDFSALCAALQLGDQRFESLAVFGQPRAFLRFALHLGVQRCEQPLAGSVLRSQVVAFRIEIALLLRERLLA